MDQSIRVQKTIDRFLNIIEEGQREKEERSKNKIDDLQEETGQIAFWYEKIRIAIDYREEHLLRRTASRRILKRLFILEGRRKEVADILLKELIMGGYVKKSDLTQEKFSRIDRAMNKYIYAFELSYKNTSITGEWIELRRWFLSIASFEVEEIIYPNKEKKALINAIYEILAPKVILNSQAISQKQKNLQTYIAIYRSLARADRAMVTSEIFRIYYREWFNDPSKKTVSEILNNPIKLMNAIKDQSLDKLSSRIFYAIKRYTLYSHILYEVCMENPKDIRNIIKQDYIFKEYLKEKVEEEYQRVRDKLRKRIKRGVIYIFLTKILIAVLIEVPFEKYFLGEINYLALAMNIIFPPLFMIFLASSVKFPGDENTEAIINGINKLVYHDPYNKIDMIKVGGIKRSKFSENTLNFIYFVIFSIVFGLIIWFLVMIKFGYLSGVIFILFLATVSFFGALIRQTVRDLVVIKEREGLMSLFFDTMLLPFVRFGRWLSTNFSRINVFMFLLDVIIEAPFKMVIRLLESWIDFLKRKREEVDQQFH